MMKIITILPLALMMACGDKDEDTGSDSGIVEEGGDTGGAE